MEAAVTASHGRRMPLPLVTTIITVAMFAVHIWVREATDMPPGDPLRLAITGALVVAFAVHVLATAQMMRAFDEFTRTIHLSALAFAFPVSMVAMFAIGYFRAEGLLGSLDPRDLVGLMLVAYGAGLAWAWRKY